MNKDLGRIVTVECPRHHLPADDRDGDYIWQCDKCREETKDIHEYKDCPDPYKCDIHIGIGGTP